MKHLLLIISSALLLWGSTSCSSDNDDLPSMQQESSKGAALSSSSDRFNKKKIRSAESTVSPTSSVTQITLTGYTSKEGKGPTKRIYSKAWERALGIYMPGPVISEKIILRYKFTVEGLKDYKVFVSNANSPECGVNPNNDDPSDIGYTLSTNGNNVELVTRVEHYISDISGIRVDKWYPRKPEQIKWNYSLVNLN